MAQHFRFSALTIFLILLGVILIGFLMHRTWESFVNNREGFSADFKTDAGIKSVDLYGKYSTDNSMTAKLADKLYFDPGNKAFINISGDMLYIKRKDGTDLSYNTATTAPNVVTDLDTGEIIASTPTDLSYVSVLGSSLTALTVGAAKTYFGALADTKYIYMDISLGSTTTGVSDSTVIGSSSVRTFFSNVASSPPQIASSSALYPSLSTNTNASFRKYKRTLATRGLEVASATTTASSVAYGWRSPTGLGVISIPLFLNSGLTTSSGATPTNTNFIHVMDMNSKKHLAAYYFQGSTVEKYSFADVNIVPTGKTVGPDTTPTTSTMPAFIGNIAGMTYDFSNTYMQVSARHDSSLNLVYIANRVGDNMFRAYIKIDTSLNPVVMKSETGYEQGSTTDSASTSNTTTDVTGWSNTSTSTNANDPLTEITRAMNLITSLQSVFGSNNSNYLLKTEVVPPVCPTCPSCSSSSGVCTSCGGNGGCGTQTTDASGNSSKSLVSTTSTTKDLGKSALDGVAGVASGTGNFLKDSGSGIGQFTKDSASGVFGAVKDSASGVYGATKEIGSGLYGTTKEIGSSAFGASKEIVGGGLGIGRDIASGVSGMFRGDEGRGGYQNSFGGPQYGQGPGQGQGQMQGQGYNQGGYLQPRPGLTPGQDPYSYYGTVPPREGGSSYIPITANFSSFGK